MKILFPFVGNSFGGSHQSALLLIEALNKNGFEAQILIHKSGTLKNYLQKRKINFLETRLPVWRQTKYPIINFFQTIIISPLIIYKLYTLKIDLVHINDGKIRNTWALGTKLSYKKLIFHQRTIFDKSKLSFFLLFLPETIISISKFVKQSLPKRFHNKVKVINNPFVIQNSINKNEAKYNICKNYSIDSKQYILSFIGSFNIQKRPLIALKTLSMLREKGIEISLLFIGKISDFNKKELEKNIKEENLRNFVKIIGFKEDITEYLFGSDFIIAPSINEGSGRILIEAMLSSTPVVASNHGGHNEIIEDKFNGLFGIIDDPISMSNSLLKLIENESLLQKITVNAKIYATKNFNTAKHVNLVGKIYRSMN